MSAGRLAVALCLAADVIDTAAWITGLLPEVSSLPPLALALVVARALVASVEAVSAWRLIGREPAAAALARMGLLGAATLTTLIVGLGLAPSDVPPGARGWMVAGYWAVAGVGVLLIGRRRQSA